MFKIVDLNPEIVRAAQEAGYNAVLADYFSEAYRTPFSVLMTASNPRWTFGGGIDYIFTQHFPKLCEYKRMKGGDMERIGNIVFSITVDNTLSATPEMVQKAIQFACENILEGETLLMASLGCGIGGMSPKEFINCLPKI